MTEKELQSFLLKKFPKENEACEWKEFCRLKHCVKGDQGNDIISYISGISNMNGGVLIIGVEDKSLRIKGFDDIANYTAENLPKTLRGLLKINNYFSSTSIGFDIFDFFHASLNLIIKALSR